MNDGTILCAWNNDLYAELFQDQGLTPVFAETGLRRMIGEKPIPAMVVLAELQWSGHETDFYGMELLCQLRADRGVTCPIAVASFLSLADLRQRFPILDFSSQHPFIRLPATPREMAATARNGKPADLFRLRDIISSCCDPRGRLIKLLTHGTGLRNLVRCPGTLTAIEMQALQDDDRLLRRYLQHSFLEKSIEAKTWELVNQLERMFIEASAENIASAQKTLQNLIRAL